MTKTLAVLGSTGSIGVQALEVAQLMGFEVLALTANSRTDIIEEQIRKFNPRFVAVADEKAAEDLKIKVADTSTKVLSGAKGVEECARCGADTVLNSIVGIAGLAPTLAAIEAGSKIALANKETLVAGGKIVMNAAADRGVDILPVDSEHSAIFQSIQGCQSHKQIKRLILTASGGPFFGKSKAELGKVTLAQALKHPNWSMGAKITIDSATMMNKGLELIEAAWLFGMKGSEIDILVHRQSIVHSLVEYVDNSVIAQLGLPDMRIPIQYALTYPDRYVSPVGQLDLAEAATLTFEKPNYETFSCINLCRKAFDMGGLYPAAVNAANEKANELFRNGRIGFLDIPKAVEAAFDCVSSVSDYTLEQVFETDMLVRRETERLFL
ncbi:MAG: 1-deoxy-D-xylulose-5-phosphate reductoisomerase [Acutalibacteraceae bacterium]|nr:1-deoxy-D-xylulose-5-phosphate reductoisomerase [Acutalibacteraceae bacterium]